MAIVPETQYPGKIAPSTPAYPYGAARNITSPGDGTGTPWEAALVNDMFGFQQALLSKASIVPTGTPDEVGASQYLQALLEVARNPKPSVAAMKTDTALEVGDFIYTSAYYDGKNAGGNLYEIVAAGTGTDDGGEYIDLDTHQAKGLFPNGRDVAQYGAGPGSAGIVADTAAFNALIAYANANGDTDEFNATGFTFKMPDGRYELDDLDPIAVSNVRFSGESMNGTILILKDASKTFRFGNGLVDVVGGGFDNCSLEYLTITVSSTVAEVNRAFRLFFYNIKLVKVGTFLSLGTSPSAQAGGTFLLNISGSVANIGVPMFDLRHGAGLHMVNVGAFVSGVLAPVHPDSMTTVLGRSVFRCADGSWDTVQCTGCTFERFDTGLSITPNVGEVYQTFQFTNTIMDYFKRYCLFADAQAGSTISTIEVSDTCWFVSWETDTVYVVGNGFNDNNNINCNVPISGVRALFYNVQSPITESNYFALKVSAANRLGTASGSIEFAPGSRGFNAVHCKGNKDSAAAGLPWRAPFGLQVGLNCEDYLVTSCDMKGSTGGYNIVEPDTPSSLDRRVFNNKNANYAGYNVLAMPASTVRHTNITPFVEEIHMMGGTVGGGYDKNNIGFPGVLDYIHLRLQHNDSFAADYSVAPDLRRFIEP